MVRAYTCACARVHGDGGICGRSRVRALCFATAACVCLRIAPVPPAAQWRLGALRLIGDRVVVRGHRRCAWVGLGWRACISVHVRARRDSVRRKSCEYFSVSVRAHVLVCPCSRVFPPACIVGCTRAYHTALTPRVRARASRPCVQSVIADTMMAFTMTSDEGAAVVGRVLVRCVGYTSDGACPWALVGAFRVHAHRCRRRMGGVRARGSQRARSRVRRARGDGQHNERVGRRKETGC